MMNVRIVTDSTADLSPALAKQLGIAVVPGYVRFGTSIYRDRVDIDEDELYRKLANDPAHPSTEPPTPQDFAAMYRKLSRGADGILSIHISGKLSATCNSALRGKELLESRCPIEIVDSQLVTMGLGLLAEEAATVAGSGIGLPQVVNKVKNTIPEIKLLGLLDTLKYLVRGGRISRTKATLGSLFSFKPMLTMKAGEVEPFIRVRARSVGIDQLFDFVKNSGHIQDLAIVHSTTPQEARNLARRISPLFPEERIKLARLGPVLGVHAGPGILFVAVRSTYPTSI